MIVDSSAMMAIILDEPEGPIMLERMGGATSLSISAATVVELRIAAERRRGIQAVHLIEDLLADLSMSVEPFDEEQAEVAHQAWQRFGKGRHGAQLNLGDTYSYALAKVSGEPLLFKGDDFRQTDVASVL